MALANDIYLIYLLRFITGLGAGGEYGIAMALIAENFPKKQVGRIASVGSIEGQLGAMLAAVLAAVVLPGNHWHALFLFGLLPVILTIFVRRHVSESPRFKQQQTKPKVSLKAMFNVGRTGYTTIALMIMAIIQIAGYFGMMNWLPTMMQQKLDLTVAGSSVWMIATITGMSVGMFVFGSILDKVGTRMAFSSFLIESAVMVYGLTLAN